MEPPPPPREDPLMLLRGSWVEVAPVGAPEWPSTEREEELEEILREAQIERGHGAPKEEEEGEEEDGGPSGQREGPERPPPPPCETLPWSWPGPPETLPPTDLAQVAPACGPLLSPALGRKEGLQEPPLMLLVVPSLMLSHALALGLGICIGKRLATSSSSAL